MSTLAGADAYAVARFFAVALFSILTAMDVTAVCSAGVWIVLNRSEQQALKAFVLERP